MADSNSSGKKGTTLSPEQANAEVIAATPVAFQEINRFAEKVFKTRGGRMGSGMGVLLEALWAYYVDQGRPAREVGNEGWEIAWLPDNEYNDYACVQCDMPWEPATRKGELFRIESKSMNTGAEESKGHFDELQHNLKPLDLLLVIIWSWKKLDRDRVSPIITDHFIGPALPIAKLRDALHIARGGSFVDRLSCADGCVAADCKHHGEPLNASGKRERLSGPVNLKPANVSYAANFGGLIRMLKSSSAEARKVFYRARAADDVAHAFTSFIHRNFPREEENTYPTEAWKYVAAKLKLSTAGVSRDALIERIRKHPDYMEILRTIEQ